MTNPSVRSKIIRWANRAIYDKEILYEVLDAGYICHLAYIYAGSPIIIPTGYVRENDVIYIHGSLKNRMMNHILDQKKTCLTVTHLDGLVLARSAFNHSFNYRSAVIFGAPLKIEDNSKKLGILELLTENILKGRWDEVRKPSDKELNATLVVGIKIHEWSVKIREGEPEDNKSDYELDIWAGELPIVQQYQQPIPDSQMKHNISIPKSVINALKD